MSLTRGLCLRPDHEKYPLCIFQRQVVDQSTNGGKSTGSSRPEIVLLLETFGPVYGREQQPERYAALTDLAVSIAEPMARPKYVHEYIITEQSLRSAGQVGLGAEKIREELLKHSKYDKLPELLEKWLENVKKQNKHISIQLYDANYYIARIPRDLDEAVRRQFRGKRASTGGVDAQDSREAEETEVEGEDLVFYQPDEPLQDNSFSRLTAGGGSYKRLLIYINQVSAFRMAIHAMKPEVELIEEAFIDAAEGDELPEAFAGAAGGGNPTGVQKGVQGAVRDARSASAGAGHTSEYKALLDQSIIRMYLDGELLEIQERQRYWRMKDRDLGNLLAAEEDPVAFDRLVHDQLGDCSRAIQAAFRLTRLYRRRPSPLQADLRSTTHLRAYQAHSVQKIVSQHEYRQHGNKVKVKKLNSGMIVLPCGSGKSLQGIATACRVGHSCIIVTNSNLSNLQWASQFRQFTTIQERRIFIFGSDEYAGTGPQRTRRLFVPGYHTVLIATYQMLTQANSAYSRTINQLIRAVVWGTVLFDEAHQLFADTYMGLFVSSIPKNISKEISGTRGGRNSSSGRVAGLPDVFLRSFCKVGLTATPLREDRKIHTYLHLLGRRLFECSWGDLASQGYLAALNCIEVTCDMSRGAYSRYWAAECGSGLISSYIGEKWFSQIAKTNQSESVSHSAQNISGSINSEQYFGALNSHPDSELKTQLQLQFRSNSNVIFPLIMESFGVDKVRGILQSKNFNPEILKRVIKLLPVLHEQKLLVTSLLIKYHISQGHQVLIFCDSVIGAEIYAKILEIPFVSGDVEEVERKAIVEAFLERRCSCILLTRVGDTSLDLPDANVLIEVNWQEKSQRQETQRIGRISRPKSSGYEGFFYIIVSSATREVHTAHERRSYLTQIQGYSFCQVDSSEIQQLCKAQGVTPHRAVHEIVKSEANTEAYLNEVVTTLRLRTD